MTAVLQEKARVKNWVREFGSPLHVVVKEEFFNNVAALQSPIRQRGLQGGLFFARKANKLAFFVEAAKEAGIGVDTASLSELRETAGLGLAPEKIILTAIGKSETLLREAVDRGCIIVVENYDELNLLTQIAGSETRAINIGLRFSGFELNGRMIYSRFGLDYAQHRATIDSIKERNLNLVLLHAHVDRYDTEERAMATRQLIQAAKYAQECGHDCKSIDLGGGILMRYLEDESQWMNFQKELISAVKGERPSFTFKGDGLGFYLAAGELAGNADFYPAWNALAKEKFVESILDHRFKGSLLYSEIASANLNLYFEPGRALLDNCGLTFAEVAFRKKDTLGQLMIGLRMNRMNLRPFRAEFCCDPLVMNYGDQWPAAEGAYLVGCLCSESDTIFRRKFQLDVLPDPGDMFLFPNSAGYLAHHMEIGTHGDPLPTNILIDPKSWEIKGRA